MVTSTLLPQSIPAGHSGLAYTVVTCLLTSLPRLARSSIPHIYDLIIGLVNSYLNRRTWECSSRRFASKLELSSNFYSNQDAAPGPAQSWVVSPSSLLLRGSPPLSCRSSPFRDFRRREGKFGSSQRKRNGASPPNEFDAGALAGGDMTCVCSNLIDSYGRISSVGTNLSKACMISACKRYYLGQRDESMSNEGLRRWSLCECIFKRNTPSKIFVANRALMCFLRRSTDFCAPVELRSSIGKRWAEPKYTRDLEGGCDSEAHRHVFSAGTYMGVKVAGEFLPLGPAIGGALG
uniref:Uncharacterized protein n=1 Tax=Mycena chlorophos TaxID=658473 RepID=A0ABQ0M7I9_MYCCL|nr:predicted protein [Mycena chlorophos]